MYVSVTSGPAIEISSGIHALEEARVTIENSALGAEKGMFFCNFANYSAHLLLPQADEPRICYCLREQDSNLPRIALLFLIPIFAFGTFVGIQSISTIAVRPSIKSPF